MVKVPIPVVFVLIGMFIVTGLTYKDDFIDGITRGASAVYKANMMPAKEFFGMILLITLIWMLCTLFLKNKEN